MGTYAKITLLILVFLCLAVFLRQKNEAFAILFSLCVCITAAGLLLPQIKQLRVALEQIALNGGMDKALWLPLIKVVGVSVCTRITAELCRDAGEKAFAAKVELAGAVTALLCAMPLAQAVIELIGGISP